MESIKTRRAFLESAAASGSAMFVSASAAAAPVTDVGTAATLRPNSIPVEHLPRQFDVEPGVHNLENGYWGVMPRLVTAAYTGHISSLNRINSIWARNGSPDGTCLAAGMLEARQAIARQVGCHYEEIAITRSGSDALQMLITNYKDIKAGDAAICCDLDYDAMIAAMDWLGDRRGVRVVKFAMPEPATTANILGAYHEVLSRTPNARLLLVTHVSNRTGLVTPVREIVAMARARGVDTVVDAAHGVACLDFKLDDLGGDFVGWSS